MAASAQTAGSSRWFWNLLKKELALYPGRLNVIARMVSSSCIITLLIMTFQLPSAALAAFYTMILSRESPRATLQSGFQILFAFCLGAVVSLVGVMIAVDYPLSHFLWVIGTLFMIFFVIRVVPNYAAAAAFSFVIATAIPAWDVTGPIDAHVYATLWTTYAVAISVIVTIGVEYVAQSFHPQDDLLAALGERLTAVEGFLRADAGQTRIPEETSRKLTQYATVGSSRLRLLLARSRFDPHYTAQMNATVALADRLVDISASFLNLQLSPNQDEQKRMQTAADRIAVIRSFLMQRKPPPVVELQAEEAPSPGIPVLPELERTISLIPYAFTGESTISRSLPPGIEEKGKAKRPWVEDAFTNPEHVKFALRGTLAATASYIIYNALDWPGISTALATCIITALSNVGSSRQKQILRLVGAIIGGFVFGIGAQAFILPGIDSITGFLLLFAVVIGISAWISTSSPRISYAGLQIALAWELIMLSDPHFQISMTIARDRVIGVLLGLVCMWIFFERLGTEGAAQQMLEIFTANVELLARLATISTDKRDRTAIIREIRSIRDKINANFTAVNAQSDAVLFESGPSRKKELAMRQQIRKWQPSLRTLFLLQLAILRYRIEIPSSQWKPAVTDAQHRLDASLAATLHAVAAYVERGQRKYDSSSLQQTYKELDETVYRHYEAVPVQLQAILALSQTVTRMVNTISCEVLAFQLPFHVKTPRTPENTVPTMQTR